MTQKWKKDRFVFLALPFLCSNANAQPVFFQQLFYFFFMYLLLDHPLQSKCLRVLTSSFILLFCRSISFVVFFFFSPGASLSSFFKETFFNKQQLKNDSALLQPLPAPSLCFLISSP